MLGMLFFPAVGSALLTCGWLALLKFSPLSATFSSTTLMSGLNLRLVFQSFLRKLLLHNRGLTLGSSFLAHIALFRKGSHQSVRGTRPAFFAPSSRARFEASSARRFARFDSMVSWLASCGSHTVMS